MNSAVRTIAYQKELRKTNKNAAPTDGDEQTSHTTGATFDIGKLGLKGKHIKWLRQHLLALKKAKKGEVVEEMHQAVFHVMVFKPVELIQVAPAPTK